MIENGVTGAHLPHIAFLSVHKDVCIFLAPSDRAQQSVLPASRSSSLPAPSPPSFTAMLNTLILRETAPGLPNTPTSKSGNTLTFPLRTRFFLCESALPGTIAATLQLPSLYSPFL